MPLLAASIVLYATGAAFQFRITRGDLERALDATLTTDHFVVHYAHGAKSRADVALTAEDLEFRYHQLRETLGVEPKLPITVWEFPSADVKKALVGAGERCTRRPWTREIFVQTSRFPSRAPAPRDGARVRGDVRRPLVRHVAGVALARPAAAAGAVRSG